MLTDLWLWSLLKTLPAIPDSFLDGSAPRLRRFTLNNIPFLGLTNLLLSATHLVQLWLFDIPHSGYISPKAIVALLSVLSSLRTLYLGFQSPQSHPDWESRSLPPPRRSVLPTRPISFQRRYRIFRGTRHLHRRPSTQSLAYFTRSVVTIWITSFRRS